MNKQTCFRVVVFGNQKVCILTTLPRQQPASCTIFTVANFLDYSTLLSSWWLHWLSVGLVIERSQVQLPAEALSSQLGQLSLPTLRGR